MLLYVVPLEDVSSIGLHRVGGKIASDSPEIPHDRLP
jgi:hypothetical protein